MIDSWEKAYMDHDYQDNPFPDELDPDGDGVIYYINSQILNKKSMRNCTIVILKMPAK